MGMLPARITDVDVAKVPMQFRIFLCITLKSESDGHRALSVMESLCFDETVNSKLHVLQIRTAFLYGYGLLISRIFSIIGCGALKDRVYV